MENNNELTVERSLEIIKRQIEQSRKELEKNAGMPFITWGIMVIVTALIVWYMWSSTGNSNWCFLWFLMAIVGWGIMVWQGKKEQSHNVPRTIITKMMSHIWFSFGIFASIFPVLMFVVAPLIFGKFALGYGITSIIILLLGLCTTITGLLLKSKWIVAGGIVGGLFGAAAAILLSGSSEMLVMAAIGLISMVIPGIMINRRTSHV
ncbi:MAG: hypothetical protein J6T82_03375 [Bacteroidaceae bacterium]|nr:hypothetical protein [Bacteroidaceae bacterium]